MHPQSNVSLRRYSTMRLGGAATYLIDVTSRQELRDAVTWAETKQLPVMMIGSGSNIVWRDEGFQGLVLVNKLQDFEIIPIDEHSSSVTIGAGENWDDTVARTVSAGLTGIEALSLIPGTAGATPVQNVGAYGQEIADTLVSVEAYDTRTHVFVTIPAADCAFGYRSSRFKTTDRGRFFITAITLELAKGNPKPPFYTSVERYLADHKVTSVTPTTVRNAVIDIRSHKLPDPASVANNGSFFSNPIVDTAVYETIAATHPDAPHWEVDTEHVKLSAAWLIEQAGFKDVHDPGTGMATWPNQPLVLVNEHAHSTADLITFRDKLLKAVREQFGIALIQEPELLP